MSTRLGFALSILTFLIWLEIAEFVISWVFSLFLQTPVNFPLVDWFFLILLWGGMLLLKITRAILLLIVLIPAVLLGHLQYVSAFTDAALDLAIHFLIGVLVAIYPLISVFAVIIPLDPVLIVIDTVILVIDTFIIGGPPILLDPPAGNIMHILFNLTRIDAIVAKIAAALTWFGIRTTGLLDPILYYGMQTRATRIGIWDRYGDVYLPESVPNPPPPPPPPDDPAAWDRDHPE